MIYPPDRAFYPPTIKIFRFLLKILAPAARPRIKTKLLTDKPHRDYNVSYT
jgi:hypothetical protein